ncbi:MAG: helix-turn-helix transcriptional regulator [Actinobacteria bacterium]|nr:helix-turn-helix transcriptional regulator [Actinomycetota bacterium]
MVSKVATMVLGLLAEGERHGYVLLREMEERGMRRWTRVSKVAVYKALARLEAEGCLTSWTEKEGNLPEKRVYALTSLGRDRLKDLVYSLCASEEPLRLDTPVGIAFITCLGNEAKDALLARIAFLERQARRLRRERDMLEDIADGIFLDILAHEQSLYRGESRWLRRIVARIEDEGLSGSKV